MRHPNSLIGICSRGSHYVCTLRSNFHLFLSNLGKTNLTADELDILPHGYKQYAKPVAVPNPVFLYDVSQLSDPDPTRNQEFLNDLQTYLGLSQPISPMIWVKPGKNLTDAVFVEREARKIDICNDEYQLVRDELMQQSIAAAKWIRNYFMQAPTVTVSNPGYFSNVILESWLRDPCVERRQKQEQLQSKVLQRETFMRLSPYSVSDH
jgi:hypothetical protein